MQGVLYLLLVGQVVLGFVARWTAGRPMLFFGAQIPSPLAKVPHSVTEQHFWKLAEWPEMIMQIFLHEGSTVTGWQNDPVCPVASAGNTGTMNGWMQP